MLLQKAIGQKLNCWFLKGKRTVVASQQGGCGNEFFQNM